MVCKSRMLRRISGTAAIAVSFAALQGLVLCANAAGAPSSEGAQVIAIVNAQRAANGIPSITTIEQGYASYWCPNEDGPFQTGEAGRVWAPDNAWSSGATPYSTAPLHQQVIYSPLATIAGDVSVKGQDCMGVGEPGLEASLAASTPTFYAFVNERGPQHAVTSELADELPTTPQQEVGFPANHRTGPQIILWAEGMGIAPKPTLVSLDSASGAPVAGARLAPGFLDVILVPPILRPRTTYRLQVKWTELEPVFSPEAPPTIIAGETVTQSLSFTTQAPPAKPPVHTHRPRRLRHR